MASVPTARDSSANKVTFVQLIRVSGGVAGGAGGAIAPPAALKIGAPKYSLGAKMTADVSEVCMVSHSRVSLIRIDITKLKRSNF